MARLRSQLVLNLRYAGVFKVDLAFLDPLLQDIGLDPFEVSHEDR
jgi:hypothetical protein